jgi:RHS repeat-associated protein
MVTKRFFGEGEQISGVNYFFTRDHLGSVREMTDASGAIQARYDYDPYGRRTKISGSLDADFAFTGDYYHAASGLYLTLYRAYDSDLGRWPNRDPIQERGGLNLYAYVANNPVNKIDPLGLDEYDWDTGMWWPDPQNFDENGNYVNPENQLGEALINELGSDVLTTYEGIYSILLGGPAGVEGVGTICEAKTAAQFFSGVGTAYAGGYSAYEGASTLTGNEVPAEVSVPSNVFGTIWDAAGKDWAAVVLDAEGWYHKAYNYFNGGHSQNPPN